jgi:hypothetical protein
MADDKAVAMIEPLGVFRMQTGPVLESTIDYEWNGASWSLTDGCTRIYTVDKIGPPRL